MLFELSIEPINYKKRLIADVEDADGHRRTNVSVYDLLCEMDMFTEDEILEGQCCGTFLKSGDKEFVIDGFNVRIHYVSHSGSLCGYIGEPVDMLCINKAKYAELTHADGNFDLYCSNILDYDPHGGFTWSNGFDCGHCDDTPLFNNYHNGSVEQSFKSMSFVKGELRKIVASIRRFTKN